MNYKLCLQCHKRFERPTKFSHAQFSTRKYCSFECWGVHQSITMKGKTSPMKGLSHTPQAKLANSLAHKKVNPISRTPAYRKAKAWERKARLLEIGGFFTHSEWLELKAKYGCKCAICEKPESEVKLTVDHIIPVSKGGHNFISNIQPLCLSCNSRKGNRLLPV